VACIKALNGALGPYQNLSTRQLEKTSEGAATLMHEMLCGAIKALESVGKYLSMENGEQNIRRANCLLTVPYYNLIILFFMFSLRARQV
jgi:hypothetical protein